MREYTIVYKSGKSEMIECADKAELIKYHFANDKTKFKNEVSRLMWNTLTMRYVEDIASEKIDAEISSADINPYGWRDA
ncbi:hypothetical protein E1176_09045 [Fulvivirga sp. RKSG066]|uniref:hypothetical protein n=1 Tax=Fulvivirga aurantia TaxID=2529383 RepID=UPI0012BC5F46|nr:hypothetical protein [Fulvivirga aurantia]MTI21163.1 hypothetical protein [Fulvivirga aurantia]